MHPESSDVRLANLDGRGVTDSYRGGQQKLLCSALAWSRPAVNNVESKNIAAKMFFFHLAAVRHLNRGNMGRFHGVPARGTIV